MGRKLSLTALSLVAVASICLVDLLSGPDIGFSLFYLIPVVVTAWYVGRGPGVILAVAGALAWLFADTVNRGGVSVAASAWNGFTRMVIFIAIAVLLDRQRTSAARLAVIDRQREDFLRVLDFELPRPVEAIAKLATKLDKATPASSEERATVQELQLRAQELQFLARDFVSLGRLQSERLLLTRKQSELNEIVREAVGAIADKPRVIITLGSEAPIVEADVDRLRQAIESVIRSALQHSTEYVNVAVRADAQSAWVDVSDRSRVPLRVDDRALFDDPGRSGDPRALAVTERFLGLELARLLMEANGGSLDIESPSTLGSLVRLRLPRATRAPIIRPATA
ncbi:MAG TPA: HAMP domain-containing sensor histidine kinase [Candidatus Limnocylindria bacterium]|nr:HAMP domain-containing sensor histidine kinase [Candidatus Limnocylindria bacterium]